MKTRKQIIILYIVLFVVVMCLPHFIYMALKGHLDTANYENRPLAEAPVIGQTPYSEFASTFEAYYNDHLPFRNQFIALNNKLNYYLFRSTTGDQVVIGKDGWLFIKDVTQGNQIANYKGTDLLSEEELSQIANNLRLNKEYFDSKGIEFVVFITPNKSRVYSEYMPDYLGEPAQDYQLLQIIDYVEKHTDVKIIYDLDAIMSAKEELAARNIPVFHKVDTHWNYAGAYAGSKLLIEELGGHMPDISQLQFEEIPNTEADLGGMLHMKADFIDTEVNYKVTGYEENNVTLELDDNDDIAVISYRSDAPDDRTIYVQRDSFAKSMGKYLGSQFKYVYMRHLNTYTEADMLSVDPDVFVLETVERGAAYMLGTFDARKGEN